MKSLNQLFCILASSLFLMCTAPIQTSAQTISGKWSSKGTSIIFNFSKEGALFLTGPGFENRYAVYYIEEGMLGVVYLDESEILVAYTIKNHTSKLLALTDEDGVTFNLDYEGEHEIPQAYIKIVLDNFGNDLGGETGFANPGNADYASSDEGDLEQWRNDQNDEEEIGWGSTENSNENTPENTYEGPKSSTYKLETPDRVLNKMQPDDLSLVGCWEAAVSGDPYVFDQNGFFRYGNFDGAYDWGYEGLYNFDGKTLTFHVHSGGGMSLTVGETYTYPIENLSSSGLNFVMGKDYNGDTYKPRYRKTNRYRLSEQNIADVKASANKKHLKNTKWTSGGTAYIFLGPDYLLIRKDGNTEQAHWAFGGNTLWVKAVNDTDYTKLGELSNWTKASFNCDTPNGRLTFKAGYNVANLSVNEQSLYMNYLQLHHAVFYQAMIGAGQGMNVYDVQWNY